ncbi:MAG: hypothetical protein AAF739_03475 [Pseudomonadota bacterium]
MLKRLTFTAILLAAPLFAQAKVLPPSETRAPQCAEGERFDQPSQRCVPANQGQAQ